MSRKKIEHKSEKLKRDLTETIRFNSVFRTKINEYIKKEAVRGISISLSDFIEISGVEFLDNLDKKNGGV